MADRNARSHPSMASGVLLLSVNQRKAYSGSPLGWLGGFLTSYVSPLTAFVRPSCLLRLPSYRFVQELIPDHRPLLRTGTGACPYDLTSRLLGGWVAFLRLTSQVSPFGQPSCLLRLPSYRFVPAFFPFLPLASPLLPLWAAFFPLFPLASPLLPLLTSPLLPLLNHA